MTRDAAAERAAFDELGRRLRNDRELWTDFEALCRHGGRMAGTASERAAQEWCERQLAAFGPVSREPTAYAGWRCDHASLTSLPDGRQLEAVPLLGTAFTPEAGVDLPVLDLGRGTPDMIAAAGEAVRGHAVMVRHEYPFSTQTVHRRVKLGAAHRAGAAAFLVVQPEAGVGPVSGSSGRAGGPGIPAMGISAEAAQALQKAGARVRLTIRGEDLPQARTDTLVLDLPGGQAERAEERVVLSAHIDGHPLAESALDNATGAAAAIALARAFAPRMHAMRRGLTVCLFSAEEWALNGSREWLAAMPEPRRAAMALNVNLDSLAGSPRLTALTSGFERLGEFARAGAGLAGNDVGIHLPLMANSDHANFAACGIPAMRLIAGFDEPGSALRLLLTPADTRALVDEGQLRNAAVVAAGVLWQALRADSLAELRDRAAEAA
ncbi:Aminopeptidase YwaD precursor [Pigmentiphaga humi]|uniref:Carboxypeptidase Q n=1 Tax=Pigmentiphaga humi TaxID=2478468 RepID=A0A3P4AVP9_9BURK|nr:M28 family peptidase [Pigmentiphaga humi]VCU68114.1 Aminopeptidase YwaD precursor [Pigmentiphaga humi]